MSVTVALRTESVWPEIFRVNDFLSSHWPRQGRWTYEDYLRLPDDGTRYEIIHGVLYMANAPSYDHQYAVSKLHLRLGSFVSTEALIFRYFQDAK